MGKILPGYKTGIIKDLIDTITSNTHYYYGFVSGAVPNSGNVKPVTSDDYTNTFLPSWQLIFGKKISNNDIKPMIVNNVWKSNTVYSKYDNTPNTVAEDSNTYANSNYYVIVPPGTYGGNYNVYVCIDNNEGSTSKYAPNLKQPTSFQTSDNYVWRYVATINSRDYVKFATDEYAPIYANVNLSDVANNYSGIDSVVITNSGNGYSSYHDGFIRSVVNSTVIQIESTTANSVNAPSTDNDYYTNNGIYIYNPSLATSQYFGVSKYVSNTSGITQTNWIYLDSPANTSQIVPSVTQYKISPKVVFNTDAVLAPVAYTTINTTSNSINSIVIIDPGAGITWANISIQSNTSYPTSTSGNRATAYVIVPPKGGHGYDPVTELKASAIGISFTFANNEQGYLPTNCTYNKVGIVKDPYCIANTIYVNNTVISRGLKFTNSYFNQILVANVNPTNTIFTVGETVKGSISNAIGTVVFSNTNQVGLVGDKNFVQYEPIISTNNGLTANIYINTFGQLYQKDLDIVYVQNLMDVGRSNTTSENYKLVIKI